MREMIVEHSRCKNCGVVASISKLVSSSDGVGMVCVDRDSCAATRSARELARTKSGAGRRDDGSFSSETGDA